MPKPNLIRCFEGSLQPYEPFWQARDAAQTGGDPEIEFYGYIGEWSWYNDSISPKKFREDLSRIGKGGPVTLRIHSGGGEIFAASAIRATLVDYPGKITAQIDGLCASAAVAIALAADTIRIHETAYMMVHNPGYGGLMGYLDADTLQQLADALRLFREGLLNAYETHTGMDREELAAMLDAETWMTAQQAVELGFANEVITGASPIKQDPQKLKQAVRNYANVPPALLNAVADAEEPPADEPGLEPELDATQTLAQERQTRVAAIREHTPHGGTTMYLRDLLKQRAEKVERAQALIDQADADGRDLTEEERTEFVQLVGSGEDAGEVGALDAQIEKIQAERERLKAAAEKKLQAPAALQAVKPEAESGAKALKRAEFNALTPAAQAAHIKAGGKVED